MRRIPAWHAYVVLGLLMTAVYFVVPHGGRLQAGLFQVFGSTAVMCIVAGVVIRRPKTRAGWLLIAAGIALFVAGDTYWDYYQWFLHRDAPFPSVADALYLSGYPFLAGGIVLLFRWPRRRPSGDVLDAAVLSVGAGGLIWLVLVQPLIAESGMDTIGHVISAAYPIMDLLVLAVIVYTALTAERWVAPLRLLAAGMGLYLLADVGWLRGLIDGTYSDGSWVDSGWLLAYIAIGAAGLHPTMGSDLVAAPRVRPLEVHWPRFAMVAGAVSIVPTVRLYALVTNRSAPNGTLVALSVAITVLAFARVALLLHEQATQRLELHRGESERARLAERIEIAEEERTTVARDLHDGPIQALTAIALKLDMLTSRAKRAGFEQAGFAAEIRNDVAAEIVSLRRLMAELRPPVLDEKGLVGALEDCAGVVFGGSAIGWTVRSELNGTKLAHDFETAAYRIAREALLNARKHSSAKNVEIVLDCDGDALQLAIADDGVGFDPLKQAETGHAGLAGSRELVMSMGGRWLLEAAPGCGTRIVATLPWQAAEAA